MPEFAPESLPGFDPRGSGLNDDLLSLLPADAPPDHEAFRAVKSKYDGNGFRLVYFAKKGTTFQVTENQAAGCLYAAFRIARACYVKLENGLAKQDLTVFKKQCLADLNCKSVGNKKAGEVKDRQSSSNHEPVKQNVLINAPGNAEHANCTNSIGVANNESKGDSGLQKTTQDDLMEEFPQPTVSASDGPAKEFENLSTSDCPAREHAGLDAEDLGVDTVSLLANPRSKPPVPESLPEFDPCDSGLNVDVLSLLPADAPPEHEAFREVRVKHDGLGNRLVSFVKEGTLFQVKEKKAADNLYAAFRIARACYVQLVAGVANRDVVAFQQECLAKLKSKGDSNGDKISCKVKDRQSSGKRQSVKQKLRKQELPTGEDVRCVSSIDATSNKSNTDNQKRKPGALAEERFKPPASLNDGPGTSTKIHVEDPGVDRDISLLDKDRNGVPELSAEFHPGDGGLSDNLLSLLPMDAPPGHEAFREIKIKTDALGNRLVDFKKQGTPFQVTEKKAAGSLYAACRIARACYVKLDAGMTKQDVSAFKKECLDKLAGRSPDDELTNVFASLLPPDAPPGHEAFRKIKIKTDALGNRLVDFNKQGISFQVTEKKAGGSLYAACRIARACYVKLDAGAAKEEMSAFKKECLAKLQGKGDSNGDNTVGAVRDRQSSGKKVPYKQDLREEEPSKRENTRCVSSLDVADSEVKAGKATALIKKHEPPTFVDNGTKATRARSDLEEPDVDPDVSSICNCETAVPESLFEFDARDSGLSDDFLSLLPTDAPPGHEAFRQVKLKYGSDGERSVGFEIKGTSFQVKEKKTAGCLYAAFRIARACYVKCDTGLAKQDVKAFSKECFVKLKSKRDSNGDNAGAIRDCQSKGKHEPDQHGLREKEPATGARIDVEDSGANPDLSLLEKEKRAVPESLAEFDPRDSGLSAELLSLLPTDAPLEHEAFRQVKLEEKRDGNRVLRFKRHGIPFQVTVNPAAGNLYAAFRIARACYVKLDAGLAKQDVSVFKKECLAKLKGDSNAGNTGGEDKDRQSRGKHEIVEQKLREEEPATGDVHRFSSVDVADSDRKTGNQATEPDVLSEDRPEPLAPVHYEPAMKYAKIEKENRGGDPDLSRRGKYTRPIPESLPEFDPRDSGLSDEMLLLLPTDAPPNHEAFREVRLKKQSDGNRFVDFKRQGTSLQVSEKQAAGCLYAAFRIARACYIKLETGLAKHDVSAFKKECLARFATDSMGKKISDDLMSLLPPDAPPGHKAFGEVKVKSDRFGHRFVAFARDGRHAFQITENHAAGCLYAAIRIARACYIKFDEGLAKQDVSAFKQQCLAKLNGKGGGNGEDTADCNNDHESNRKHDPAKRKPQEELAKKEDVLHTRWIGGENCASEATADNQPLKRKHDVLMEGEVKAKSLANEGSTNKCGRLDAKRQDADHPQGRQDAPELVPELDPRDNGLSNEALAGMPADVREMERDIASASDTIMGNQSNTITDERQLGHNEKESVVSDEDFSSDSSDINSSSSCFSKQSNAADSVADKESQSSHKAADSVAEEESQSSHNAAHSVANCEDANSDCSDSSSSSACASSQHESQPKRQGRVCGKMLVRAAFRCSCHFATPCPANEGQVVGLAARAAMDSGSD